MPDPIRDSTREQKKENKKTVAAMASVDRQCNASASESGSTFLSGRGCGGVDQEREERDRGTRKCITVPVFFSLSPSSCNSGRSDGQTFTVSGLLLCTGRSSGDSCAFIGLNCIQEC